MSQASYRASLRAPSRGLWSGALLFGQFSGAMQTSIARGLTQAWNVGARSVGLAPGDRSFEEWAALERAISREIGYINELGVFIMENSRAKVGPGKRRAALRKIYARLNLWVKRWLDVKNQAVLMGRGDPKLIWVYDPKKENCKTCAALHNKVKRQSFWNKVGVRPQDAPNPLLDCEGWQCGCQLLPTDLPLSRGRLPNLP